MSESKARLAGEVARLTAENQRLWRQVRQLAERLNVDGVDPTPWPLDDEPVPAGWWL